MTTASQMQAAVDKVVVNMDRLHRFVNGAATETVGLDTGSVPSMRKLQADLEQQVEDGLADITVDTIPGLNTVLGAKVAKTDLASPAADKGAALVGYKGRTVAKRLGDVVSLADFVAIYGGAPDGIADCSLAIQRALEYLNDIGGGTLHIPVGKWRKADTTYPIQIYEGTTIAGDGDESILFHDDRPTNTRNDMFYCTNIKQVCFRDFKILGTLRTYPTETNFCQALTGSHIGSIRMSNVTIEAVRQMATVFDVVDDAIVIGCTFKDVIRDGVRFVQARNVTVTGNTFIRVADDCIAVHSRDDYPGTPIPHNVTIVGNTMDTCQGIKLLGCRNATIVANTMRYMIQSPICLDCNVSLPEGNSPVYSLLIANNTILDTLNIADTNYVISIQIRERSKQALTAQPGAVAPVFPYTLLTDTDNGPKVNLGAFGITISDNIIGWAAPRGVQFSTYAGGDIVIRDSSFGSAQIANPTITDANYNCIGITVTGPVRSLLIKGNQFFGGGTTSSPMIYLGAGTYAANTIVASNVVVKDNIFSDCPNFSCLSVEYLTTNGSVYINVEGNTFDLDPFFRNSQHTSENRWNSDDSCIPMTFNGNIVAGVASGNHFKNCSRLFGVGGEPILFRDDNYAYFNFDSGGVFDGSAGNLGIRNVPFVPRATCVMIDGNPASATFQKIVTLPAMTAAAMPSTGRYVRGHFTRNVSPTPTGTAGSQYVVTGWLRLTNGSSHTLNTDWVELRSPTGS